MGGGVCCEAVGEVVACLSPEFWGVEACPVECPGLGVVGGNDEGNCGACAAFEFGLGWGGAVVSRWSRR